MPPRTHCCYCGVKLVKRINRSKDHLFPDCLYPASLSSSQMRRPTVPACVSCNASFSDDEAHFRNILPLCGLEPEPVVAELFEERVLRSLNSSDGPRRVRDLSAIMRPDDQGRTRIYPFEDPRFLRIVRKIVRALSWHHEIDWPVTDDRVTIERMPYLVPPGLTDGLVGGVIPGGLCRWWLLLEPKPALGESVWLITLRSSVTILARVTPRSAESL